MKASEVMAFIAKHWWVWCLILITVFSFWSRMLPARYGELQALDPFYAYRMNEYMLSHNLELPLYDYMRYWPNGVPIEKYGPPVYFYVPVVMYVVLMFFGVNVPYLDFAITYPAFMGALSVFIMFWLAREIFRDNRPALFSALFLATIPAYIARTSAGFFDKEATGGTLLLLSLYLFVRSYRRNSWMSGILAALSVFLAIGSWGGAQFFIYVISVFLIALLLLNRYKHSLIMAAVPSLIAAVLSEKLLLGYVQWTFEQFLAIVTISLILIRFGAERYKLVKREQLQYLMPAVIIMMIVFVLVGSIFSDYLWDIVMRGLRLVSIAEKGYIGSTVAEQMEGTWNDVVSRTTVTMSNSIVPVPPPLDTLFSVWFLMILGSLVMVYNIYTKRDWVLLLPMFWLVMSIQTVMYMVRLVFFLGPPAAIVAGYFVAYSLKKFSSISYMRSKEGLKKVNVLSLSFVLVLSYLVAANLATGYVFSNSVGPSFNQYWQESMDFMSEQTPVNSSILSWWDFGYWFQTKGNRPSIADGGNLNGSVNEHIADWYVSNSQNWTDFRPWLNAKDVDYILMDYTLPGKYGAISKIASRGKTIVGMLQFQQTNSYPQENKTIQEFKAGQYVVWLPVVAGGGLDGPPIFMVSQGDQFVGRTYISDVCTPDGIIRFQLPENSNGMGGCITISSLGLYYIPPEAEFSIFTNLMFMDGYGIPDVEKVFDNQLIKIYKLNINETSS